MRSAYPQRDLTSRTHGPSVMAAGDGLEGSYSAIIHTAPSSGTCKVVIPSLSLTHYYTAKCPSALTGIEGDAVLITFDEQKQPWITCGP